MKKNILFVCLLIAVLASNGQDTIYFTNNSIVAAKITDINAEEITFKKMSYLEGPNIHEKKKNILRVRYSNGDMEFYEENENFGLGNTTDRGETAVIILNSDKAIPCEVLDMTTSFVIYKERGEPNNHVITKSFVAKIMRPDSSYSTFTKEGQEVKHDKPAPVIVPPPKADPVAVVNPEETKVVPTPPVKPAKPDNPKQETGSEKNTYKVPGECTLMDEDGTQIEAKDLILNFKTKTLVYTDQFNKIIRNKSFKDYPNLYIGKGSNRKLVDLRDEKLGIETFEQN